MKIFAFIASLCLSFTLLSVPKEAHSNELPCNWKWRLTPAKEKVRGTWGIKANTSCMTRHMGRLRNLAYVFHGMQVVKQPEHGSIGIIGRMGIRYVPDRDFHGRDYTEVAIILRHVESGNLYPTVVRTTIRVRK